VKSILQKWRKTPVTEKWLIALLAGCFAFLLGLLAW
jgi:hypothetical protein